MFSRSQQYLGHGYQGNGIDVVSIKVIAIKVKTLSPNILPLQHQQEEKGWPGYNCVCVFFCVVMCESVCVCEDWLLQLKV